MAVYTSPFAAVAAFANLAKQAALPLFQPGQHLPDGTNLDKLSAILRSMLGQNGQPPMPATFTDLFTTGTLYRSFTDGLVALAGGGQAGATPITTGLTTAGTVATAGDSVLLPSAAPGAHPLVANAGANSLNVFPAIGEVIGAGAANAAFAIPAGKAAQFFATAPGRWRALLSA